jgi:regulatory protein
VGKITAIHARKGQGKRLNIFLDGKFAFSLEAEVAVKEGLKPGQEITASRNEVLVRSDQYLRCLNAAAHLLGYRPRSECELRERLHQRGFRDKCIQETLDKLKEQGLMNDLKFAQFWKENRETFSPRSQWLIKSELRRKGVAEKIIEQATDDLDDGSSAYRLALKKSCNLSLSDHQLFQRRLQYYLKRHGFGYDITKNTIERIWQDLRE